MSPFVRQLLLFLHLIAAMAWVGGMFFAYFCLRPAAADTLDPPKRLPLWAATFKRFLPYTAVAVAVILVSGLALLVQNDWRQAPLGWNIMTMLGAVMTLVFGYVYLVLFPRLRAHCDLAAWPAAAQALNAIRRLVAINLTLGVCAVAASIYAR